MPFSGNLDEFEYGQVYGHNDNGDLWKEESDLKLFEQRINELAQRAIEAISELREIGTGQEIPNSEAIKKDDDTFRTALRLNLIKCSIAKSFVNDIERKACGAVKDIGSTERELEYERDVAGC